MDPDKKKKVTKIRDCIKLLEEVKIAIKQIKESLNHEESIKPENSTKESN